MTDFNGGKMEHIFEFVSPGGKKAMYAPKYTSEAAAKALNSPDAKWYMKVDGSCGALVKGKEGWEIYSRFDDTKKQFKESLPDGYISLPESGNQWKYEGHRYYLRHLPRPVAPEEGKKLKGEAVFVDDLYRYLDKCDLSGLPPFVSVELVGKNYNRTPGVEGNKIAVHAHQKLEVKTQHRTEEEWLQFFPTFFAPEGKVLMEGVVIEHRGTCYKLRSDHVCEHRMPREYRAPIVLQ